MMYPTKAGSTIAYSARRYLECGKLQKCSKHGWIGLGYCFARDECFRVWTSQWFPVGSFLATECAIDVDLYCIDYERTLDINGFDPAWIEANQPSGFSLQLELGV